MYYDTYNRKWGDPDLGTDSGEITWSAVLGSNLQFDNGETQTDFYMALQDAFDAWETVADIDFTYVPTTDSGSTAKINVIVDAIDGKSVGTSGGTVGYASWGGGVSYTFGTITFDEAKDWAPTGSGGIDFYAVALHEIGHVLGLKHYEPNPGDPAQIMNPSISADDLQSGDIAGVQYLYGAGDGVAPPPTDPSVFENIPDAPADDDTGGDDTVPPSVASDDGGSSSSAIGMLVGLLGLVIGMIFGGGGGIGAFAAGRVDDDPADGDGPEDEILLGDLIPIQEIQSHAVYVDDFGNFIAGSDHEHGCDCGQCCGADEDMFLV